MQILFRADASRAIGTGHVMRCLTLADELASRGHVITFASRQLEGDLRDFVGSKGFQQLTVPPLDPTLDQQWCAANSGAPDVVVVDHYGLDQQWEAPFILRSRLLVIDDRANRAHVCHAILDQNFYLEAEHRYDGLIPSAAMGFFGPRYALLRQDFRDRPRRARAGASQNILILYGGSDPTSETEKAVQACLNLADPELNVRVICGPSMAELPPTLSHPNIEILGPTNQIAELMDWADIGLGAGGSTSWERCHRGLPSLVTSVSDDQIEIARDLATTGAIITLGHAGQVTADDITQSLAELRQDPKKLTSMSEAGLALVPGDGVRLVADWISA